MGQFQYHSNRIEVEELSSQALKARLRAGGKVASGSRRGKTRRPTCLLKTRGPVQLLGQMIGNLYTYLPRLEVPLETFRPIVVPISLLIKGQVPHQLFKVWFLDFEPLHILFKILVHDLGS